MTGGLPLKYYFIVIILLLYYGNLKVTPNLRWATFFKFSFFQPNWSSLFKANVLVNSISWNIWANPCFNEAVNSYKSVGAINNVDIRFRTRSFWEELLFLFKLSLLPSVQHWLDYRASRLWELSLYKSNFFYHVGVQSCTSFMTSFTEWPPSGNMPLSKYQIIENSSGGRNSLDH